MNGKHTYAIEILRQEVNRLGGELFAQAVLEMALKARAENGDKEAEEQLSVLEFTTELFNNVSQDKQEVFDQLVVSMVTLKRLQESDK